jgi:hypothetical protein
VGTANVSRRSGENSCASWAIGDFERALITMSARSVGTRKPPPLLALERTRYSARRGARPTLGKWRTDANDICRRLNQELRQLGAPSEDDAAFVDFLRGALPIATEATNQLRALEGPSSDAPQIDRYLGLMDDQVELARDAIQAWDDDRARFDAALADLGRLDRESREVAAELGADDCAEQAFAVE